MKANARTILFAATLAAGTLIAGCSDIYPEPSQDAVYYYLAGARLHGKVRVCWPEGQEYVTRITKADAELAKLLAPLRALLDPGVLWPPDDPRWQDQDAVKNRATELADLLSDEARQQRQEALDALEQEIDDLPPSLKLTGKAEEEAFKKRLHAALMVDGQPLRDHVAALESVAEAFRDLYAKAATCAETIDPDIAEFGYADETCRREVMRLYKAARDAVSAQYQRFLRHAATRMNTIRETIDTLDKKKQRERYTLLDNERTYYKRTFERRARKIQSLIRHAERELSDAHRKKDAAAKRRIAFLKRQIERYQALVAATQQQKRAIVDGNGVAPTTANQ